MPLNYHYDRLCTTLNSEEFTYTKWTKSAVMQIPTVMQMARHTNKTPYDLVMAAFADTPDEEFIGSAYYNTEKIREHILTKGYPYTESLLEYGPYLTWCRLNDVRDPEGGLIDAFGKAINVPIAELVDTVDVLRKGYL